MIAADRWFDSLVTNEAIHGMSENYPPVAQAFCGGPVDQRAVRDYLEIKDDGEITRLAAMLAAKMKTSDPAALVDAAMALQSETTAALIRKRDVLASTMSYPTLLALQEALGTSLSMCVEDDDERLVDPILGPVMRRISSTASDRLKLDRSLAKDRIANSLNDADKRTKLPRPSLPCDLEVALHYATNSPQIPWPVLKRAFIDFLGIHPTTSQKEDLYDETAYLNGQIECHLRTIEKLKKNPQNDPQNLKAIQGYEERMKNDQDKLAKLQAAATFRQNFSPGLNAPPGFSEEADALFSKYWHDSGSVEHESSLEWLSTEFNAFWKNHHVAYQKQYAAQEKEREAKTAKNRKAAKISSRSRERGRWLKHTKDFVNFWNADQTSSSDLTGLIKIFADKHCGLSTKPAQDKVQDFLGTLASYTVREFDGPTILEILRKSGIKSLTEDAVRECLTVLKSATDKGSRKKSKKPL